MDIVVLAKWVPVTQVEELKIIEDGKRINLADIPYHLNEWDTYALEEAARLLKEKGGTGWVVSLGDEEADSALRRGIAMGMEKGVLLEAEAEYADPFQRATIFKNFLEDKGIKFDLLLTGGQAEDDEFAATGGILAGLLGLPYASMVIGIEEVDEERITLLSELEGGITERIQMMLPAVLSIQTGINEPRYISVSGVLKAAKKEREFLSAGDFTEGGTELLQLLKLEVPPSREGAQMIEGSLGDKVSKIMEIIKEKVA